MCLAHSRCAINCRYYQWWSHPALDRTSFNNKCAEIWWQEWGDGGDCIFELSKSSSSCRGALAPGSNVGTRIKGTIQFTFIGGRELFFSKTPGRH